jgi:hypothetical protein
MDQDWGEHDRAMDIKKLKAFATVAEFGSFSRAAAVLGVVQPMLSRQVRPSRTTWSRKAASNAGRLSSRVSRAS